MVGLQPKSSSNSLSKNWALVMCSSSDGFLASGPEDNMYWTGKLDKFIFKILTIGNTNGVVAVSEKTMRLMPKLDGRILLPLSRECIPLELAASIFENVTLIGGPTLAKEALKLGIISRFTLTTIINVNLGSGIKTSDVVDLIPDTSKMITSKYENVVVNQWIIGEK